MKKDIIFRSDIDKEFTNIVNNYLSAGYKIYTNTMGGSQGEIAKIDLTNGKEIVRVLLESRYEGCSHLDSMKIRLLHFELDDIRPDVCCETLWNYDDKEFSRIVYYRISNRGWQVFTKSEQLINEIAHKRDKRYENKRKSYTCSITPEKMITVVNRQKGFKTLKAKDIVSIQKGAADVKYTVTFANGKWLNFLYDGVRFKIYRGV